MKKDYKIGLIIVIIFLLLFIYKVYQDHIISLDLKESDIIIGKVDSIEYTRGTTFVHVQYVYNGHIIQNFFGTTDRDVLDSLKKQKNIIIRVSKRNSTKYIEYIGVNNPPNDDN